MTLTNKPGISVGVQTIYNVCPNTIAQDVWSSDYSMLNIVGGWGMGMHSHVVLQHNMLPLPLYIKVPTLTMSVE